MPQLAEQARVLDGDDGLCGEIRDQLDLLVGERPNFLPVNPNRADQFSLLEHRHVEKTSRAPELGGRHAQRFAIAVRLLRLRIDDMDRLLGAGQAAQAGRGAWPDWSAIEVFRVGGRHAKRCDCGVGAILIAKKDSDPRLANAGRVLQHGLEHRLNLAGRARDDTENL